MKINRKKFQAFRQSHTREVFCTKEATYDIVLAMFLIEEKPRPVDTVEVAILARVCGFDRQPVKEEDGILFFQCVASPSKVLIDGAHAQKDLDLDQPLIFADGQLIDGHHRLYRAFLLGVETLKAYTLTPEEAKAC